MRQLNLQRVLLPAAAVATLVLVIFVYWWVYFRDPHGFRSPSALERIALNDGDAATRQKAALELARHPDKPLPHLRSVFQQSQDAAVKAAVALGLGRLKDWESMPELLNALDSESAQLRANAALAVNKMLGIDYKFRADDPPQRRAAKIKTMRQMYEAMNKLFSNKDEVQ